MANADAEFSNQYYLCPHSFPEKYISLSLTKKQASPEHVQCLLQQHFRQFSPRGAELKNPPVHCGTSTSRVKRIMLTTWKRGCAKKQETGVGGACREASGGAGKLAVSADNVTVIQKFGAPVGFNPLF